MRLIFFSILVFGCSFSFAQTLEFSAIHWDTDDGVKTKVHVKTTLEASGKTASDLRKIVSTWYRNRFVETDLIRVYKINPVTGKMEWMNEENKPLFVDEKDRIWTPYVKCKNCLAVRKNDKNGADGLFQMDIRFKEGKLLLVLANHYSIPDDSYLSDWVLNRKGELQIEENDSRQEIAAQYFSRLVDDLSSFIANPTVGKEEPTIDDW